MGGNADDYRQAAEYWQRMYEQTFAVRTCRNDSLKRGAGVFVCSECGIYLDIADMNWDGEDDSGGFYDPNYCPNCGAKVVNK